MYADASYTQPKYKMFFKIRTSIKITLCTQMQGHSGFRKSHILDLCLTSLTSLTGDDWLQLGQGWCEHTRAADHPHCVTGIIRCFHTTQGQAGQGGPDVSTDLRMCQIPDLSLATEPTDLSSDWLMAHWSGFTQLLGLPRLMTTRPPWLPGGQLYFWLLAPPWLE